MACALAAFGCNAERQRPTGLASSVPETQVEIAAPPADGIVPRDSTTIVLVRASGLLQGVGFAILGIAQRDTLVRGFEELEEPMEVAEVAFEVEVPAFPTGTNLELRGIAENVIGERTFSESVFVVVIDCTRFVFACQDL